MEAMLKATEVAQLMGCSKEYVTRMAREGRLEHEKTLNERNRPMLLFPVSGLEPQLQEKYYAHLKANLPEVRLPDGAGPKRKTPKAFDQYTADEREEIAWWLKTVDEWQTYRAKYPGKKAEADEKFIALCAKIDPEHEFSIDILYRKWKAVKDNDLDGLIDKRGKWRKGKSSIDETLWQAFLSFYLDENQHPIMRCYEYTKMWAREDFPDLVADMPSYTTFYRRIQSDIPEAVEVLGRQGEKAFRDRCAPYIKRTYDDMASNEWWIADNHTFDIITMGANGKRHRLYLTAFFDARSGIFTGCHVTTAPSSQSTLVALRKGILKYGIPDNIYVDNGREFLTYDIGGLGHRKKKPKNGQEPFSPPPVFERLGIKMTNAIVRNAKAKIIERRFEDIKNQLSRLFETYTGGNVLEKPEKLKGVLKNGEIPMDSTLIAVVEQLLEGYFNESPYYAYFKPQFDAFGIDCDILNWTNTYGKPNHENHKKAFDLLKQGYYLIALMNKGLWTSSGHFIVVWWEDGKVRINDPASTKESRLNGDPITFKSQVKYYWWVDARKYNESGNSTSGSTISAPTSPLQSIKTGDIVSFTGTKHYSSSNGINGKVCKPGKAKVTAIAKSGKHPYHLIRTIDGGSTVYGWVDAKDISSAYGIQKGSKVKVLQPITYSGSSFKVYYDAYDVLSVDGDRVVIGIGKTVTAAVNVKNLQAL